jgi:hypothetical protein
MAVRRISSTLDAEPNCLQRPETKTLQPAAPIRVLRHPPVPRGYLGIRVASGPRSCGVKYGENAVFDRPGLKKELVHGRAWPGRRELTSELWRPVRRHDQVEEVEFQP